jgi:hypothetical protein
MVHVSEIAVHDPPPLKFAVSGEIADALGMSYALAETNEDLAAIKLAAMTRNVVAFMLSRSAVATDAEPTAATASRTRTPLRISKEKAEAPRDASAGDGAPREECAGGSARADLEMVTAAAGEPGWWTTAAAVCFAGWRTKKLVRI